MGMGRLVGRRIGLFCVILFSLVSESYGACQDDQLYQTYNSLKNCLQSEEFDASVRDQTLQTLLTIIPSYVFVDSSLNSADPEHIPMQVNITADLLQIGSTTYNYDVELQEAIAGVFTSLQDAHTRYTKPLHPYVASSFVLPFTIYSRVESDTQKIY